MSDSRTENIAIIGCGFVADLYMANLRSHPELRLAGVWDRDATRCDRFSELYGVNRFGSLEELLDDSRISVVVNLTNPRSHFEVTAACLEAGKHVYSEKPLAMTLEEATAVVELAERRGLLLSSAPCSLLGASAQKAWRAVREQRVGRVLAVYAEMDDGLVHRMPFRKWRSASGAPWPYVDEFEVGCTLEHAGYHLVWLPALFGAAKHVTAYSSCRIPGKGVGEELGCDAPDLSIACIQFESGVVARLTCSIIAPHDHRLRVFGEQGELCVADCWDYQSRVYIRRQMTIRRRRITIPWKYGCPAADSRAVPSKFGAARMDFFAGVGDMVQALRESRQPLLNARYCLHVNEMVLAISGAGEGGRCYQMRTGLDAAPACWG